MPKVMPGAGQCKNIYASASKCNQIFFSDLASSLWATLAQLHCCTDLSILAVVEKSTPPGGATCCRQCYSVLLGGRRGWGGASQDCITRNPALSAVAVTAAFAASPFGGKDLNCNQTRRRTGDFWQVCILKSAFANSTICKCLPTTQSDRKYIFLKIKGFLGSWHLLGEHKFYYFVFLNPCAGSISCAI